MKNTILILFFWITVPLFIYSQGPIRCGTTEYMNSLINSNSNWALSMNLLENEINNSLNKVAADNTIIDIPVVVHVVYNTQNQNISDAQIQSQITVLNQDYRKLPNTPGWNNDPIGADTYIQFHLATIDPNGNSTNGITRTATNVSSFTYDDAVKYTSRGGCNIWDRTKYLNIWVCNLSGGLLGYAQFPNYPGTSGTYAAETDGVVILYNAFGNTGTQGYPGHYDMGRTTTHEVGHWIALRHIWGDADNCGGTDYVDDTNPCSGQYFSGSSGSCDKPVQCGYTRQTDDYMDYSDDRCMDLMTIGQRTRMRAAIMIARPTFMSLNITIDQKLADNSTSVGTIGRWNGSTFPTPRLNPGDLIGVIQGSNEVLQGDQTLISNQKYYHWVKNFTETDNDVSNHHVFYISPTLTNITSHFNAPSFGITIKNEFPEYPGFNPDNDQIQFIDPWYIDYPDPAYGNTLRNRGMNSTIPRSRLSPFNPNNQDTYENGQKYNGVFLGQSGGPNWIPPYYSVSSIPTQNLYLPITNSYHNFYFQNWSASGANFNNPNSGTTAVVFSNSNAVVNANYKGTQLSANQNSFTNSSQRKVLSTFSPPVCLFQVYESMGSIWMEKSTDGGTNWSLYPYTNSPLISGTAEAPSLDHINNSTYSMEKSGSNNSTEGIYEDVIFVPYVINYEVRIKVLSSYYASSIIDCQVGFFGELGAQMNPVIATFNNGNKIIVIWKGYDFQTEQPG